MNLDAMNLAELERLLKGPKALHPLLRGYAKLKVKAMRLRLQGRIETASMREAEADKLYERLPDDLRW